MTQPASNPPAPSAPAEPSKALRLARLLIALGLITACGVFSVFAIREIGKNLAQGQAVPLEQPTYPDRLPGDLEIKHDNELLTLGQPGQGTYIDHPPGHIPSFRNAAPYDRYPHRDPISRDGFVTEHGHYKVPGSTTRQAFDHYDQEATQRGMKLVKRPANPDDPQADLLARWVKDQTYFQLTVTPLVGETPNVKPPKRATPPLRIVVQYSYPAPTK